MTYKRRPGNSPHFRPCSRCDTLIRDAECYFFSDSPKVYYCKNCAESLHRMRTGEISFAPEAAEMNKMCPHGLHFNGYYCDDCGSR